MSDNEKVSEPSVEEFLKGIKSTAYDKDAWVMWMAILSRRMR